MTDSRPAQLSTLKPYLTLPQLFSLTWLAYPIISLLFVAFRLQISSAQAQSSVADAKSTLLASCRAAEKAATSAASLPRYLALGTNERIVDAVNDTLNGARETLALALTIMEAIVNFIIDTYRSTFLCFLELVVRGSLDLLIGASQEITTFVQNTLNTIASGISTEVDAANSAINSAIGVINKATSIFGGGLNIPTISINLDSLSNITLPTTFTDALTSLNSTIPSLDDLRTAINNLVDTPFELLKKDINDTFAGISFNSSVLPVPQQNTVSFCANLDTSVVDNLGADLVKIVKLGLMLILAVVVLLILGNCMLEWYKYRCLLRSLERTRRAWTTDPTVQKQLSNGVPTVPLTDYNLLELHAASTHPLLMFLANKLSALLRLSPSQYISLRWFFAYVFHPPALACLLIGGFGLISVELQLAAIGPLEHRYTGEVAAAVSNMTLLISTSFNEVMQNQSTAYATAINTHVDTVQSTINDGLFGWVNVTTTTLNNTIVAFYTDIQDAIDAVFNGTVLDAPIQNFVKCLIGSKIDAFENALTFLHDNLNVNFPRVNDSILLISPESMNEVAKPISAAAVGDQSEGGTTGGVIGALIGRYVDSLKKERVMFLIFLGLWGIVVLMAISNIIWHSYIKPALEDRRHKKWERDARSFENAPWLPTMHEKAGSMSSRSVSPSSPPTKALGVSNSRRARSSWDSFVDRGLASTPITPTVTNKLVAWGRKQLEKPDDARSLTLIEEPEHKNLWGRLKSAFRSRDAEVDDWIARPDTSGLPPPLVPVQPSEKPQQRFTPPPPLPILNQAPRPRVSVVPEVSTVASPQGGISRPVSVVRPLRFPPPPQLMPVPLHHHFARHVPSDTPRSPFDVPQHSRSSSFLIAPVTPQKEQARVSGNFAGIGAGGPPPAGRASGAHVRMPSQLGPPKLVSKNPFSTPFDEQEESPFDVASKAMRPFIIGRAE